MKKVYAAITGMLFTLLLSFSAFSQTLIPYSGSNSMNSNGTLCTHAGCGASYSDWANGYTVLNVTSGNRVQISGSYSTESCCDYVAIYDGVGTGGTQLAIYNGAGSFCFTGNFSQTITVQFRTDVSIVSWGLNATVTYNPSAPADPTSVSISSPVICNGTSTTLTANGAVGTVYWYTGSCGGTQIGTGNSISVSPSSTTTYYARNYNNCVYSVGCASTTVTVNTIPTVNSISAQIKCNGGTTNQLSFTGAVPGTVFNWTNNTTSIGLSASGSGDISSFTALNTGTSPAVGTIVVTPSYTNAGVTCTGSTGSTTITVNPSGQMNDPADQVVCHNTSASAVNFSTGNSGGTTTYAWTNDNTSIGLAASGNGNISSFTATNSGSAPVTATITVTPTFTNGGVSCSGTPQTFTITVNPKGQVNNIPNQVFCSGSSTPAFNFTTNYTGGTTTYTWTNDKTSIGLAASGTGNIASFTATNSSAIPVVATITVTPTYTNGGTGCAGTSTSFTISVNPIPAVNQPASQVICNNASSATVSFGNKVLILAGDIPAWLAEIQTKLQATGAFSAVDVMNAGVMTPTVAQLQAYQSVFLYSESGFANSILLGNNLATYVDGGGGLVMSVFATASLPVDGAINTSAYQVMIPAGQTQGSMQTLGTVWLPAHPLMNGVTSFNGGTSSYRSTSTSLAAGGYRVADWNDGRYLITARDDVGPAHAKRVDLGFFPPSKDSRGDFWDPASDGVKIMKNALIYAGGGGGIFDYSWTNDNTSIGLAASGTGDVPVFTAVNTGSAPVSATITVTPSFTYGGETCTGATKTFTFTVNPAGQMNGPTDQVVSTGGTTTAVNFTTNNTGGTTTYAWTNNTTSIGLSASGTGNIASFTATNVSNATVVATITVTPTFTNGSTSCSGIPQTFTIAVSPTPTVNAISSQTICNSSSTGTVTFTGSVAGTVFSWTNNNTSIGLAASGTGNIASFTGTNAGNSPEIAVITVTPSYTSNGYTCYGTARTFSITVNPTPVVNDITDLIVCKNGTTGTITFSSPTTGPLAGKAQFDPSNNLAPGVVTFSWTNNDVSIGLAASGTGNIASFTALNTGTDPDTAVITVTPSTNTSGVICTGTPKTFRIIVNPAAQMNDPADQVVCNAGNTSSINFTTLNTGDGTTTYSWTNNNTSIGLAASGTGNISSFTVTNVAGTPAVATITVTPSFTNGGVTCSGAAQTFTITVNPLPQIEQPADQVVCNNAMTTAVNQSTKVLIVAADVPEWTLDVQSKLNATGAFSSVDIFDASTGTPTLAKLQEYKSVLVYSDYGFNNSALLGNNLAAYADGGGGVVLALFATGSSPVGGAFNSTTYNVMNVNSNTQGTTQTLGTVHLPAHALMNGVTSFNGGSGSWRSTASSLTAGSYSVADWNDGHYLITAKDDVGPAHVKRVDLGFYPPSSDARSDFWNSTTDGTKIIKNALQYVSGMSGGGGNGIFDYSWTNSDTSIGLAGSGTGDVPAFTAVNNSTTPVTATITITPSFTSSGVTCTGTPRSFTITVNPTGQMSEPADQVICDSNSTTAVNFATNNTGGTTTYSWTNNNTSIGLAASGNGNIPSFIALNPGNNLQVATITVTPTFTNGGVSCSGTAQTFTITVNPSAQVNAVSNIVVCNNAVIPTIYFGTTRSGGATYCTWINDNTSIGLAASGAPGGWISSFTAVNNGTTPQVATITVIPTITNEGVTCSGKSVTFTITVNPTAQVNDPADQVICNNGSVSAVQFSTDNSGGTTTYAWTNTTTSIGLAASGTGNIASFTAVNNGTSPVTATITVTPTFTNAGVSCSGASQTFTIIVNPTAQVEQPVNQVVCINATVSQVFTTLNNGGTTTYAWTNDNTAIGLAASGTGNINTFNAKNTGTTPITAIIVVTPTFTNAGVSCTGPSKTFYYTVNPLGQVAKPADQVLCNKSMITAVNFQTVNTGGTTTYSWTNSAASIGLAASGNGNIPAFNALNGGTSPVIATITVTPTFTNDEPAGMLPTTTPCTGPSETFTITVNPTAQVNQPTNVVLCNGAPVAVPFSTINTGGATTYYWTNDHTSIGLAASGDGNVASFIATNTGTTPVVAHLTVTPTFMNDGVSCSGTPRLFTITVNPTAQVNDPANQVKCNGSLTDAVDLTTENSGGTTVYNWINDNTSIGLTASGTGNINSFTAVNNGTAPVTATITVTPTFTNDGVSCSGPSQSFTITVNPTAQVEQPADQVICNGNSTSVTYATVNTGGTTTYSWTNSNTAIGLAASGNGNIPSFTVTNSLTTPITATLTVTPTFTNAGVSCSGPAMTFTITVDPTPTLICPANISVTNDAGVNGAVVNYPAAIVTGTPAPVVNYSIASGTLFPIGTTTVNVTATNNCAVINCSFTVTVRDTELPVITCPSDITVTAAGACTKVVTYAVSVTDNAPGFTLVRTAGLASGAAFPIGVTTVTHRVTDASGNISQCSFTVTVLDGQIPAITTQPMNTTVCATTNATFSVAATNVVSYQWQSLNGGVWSDISGSTGTVLTVNNPAAIMNGSTYRANVIGLCTSTLSNVVTMNVNAKPFITITASGPTAMVPGKTISLTANVSTSGGTYIWYKNDVQMDVTGTVISNLTVEDAGTYKVVYTDGNGCTSASAEMQITALESTKLYAYPNPNSGKFSVRFYNQVNDNVTLSIFNDRGRLLYQRKYLTSAPYTNMEIDLIKEGILSSGYFMVEVRDHTGKQIATKTIIVYR